MLEGWKLKQQFSLRASTMLLLFTAAITALGLSDLLFELFGDFSPDISDMLWRFGVNVEEYSVIAALIALGFFAHSIYRKNPQWQFVVEISFCLIIYLLV